jgi:hypothetical protein
VITRTSSIDIEGSKDKIKDKFKMSEIGLLSNYLGIEVQQRDGDICLSQWTYAIKALERARPDKCNSCNIYIDGTSPSTEEKLWWRDR